jgi:O-antigen/teichoic acid export membrane protein
MSPTSPQGTVPPARRDSKEFDRSFVRSVLWTGLAKGGSQLLGWIATFIVARLLTPGDYGLVGMATVFLGVVTLVSEFGIGVTIVTLRDLDGAQVAQLNTVAVLLGAAGFLACIAAALPLGWFFRSEALPVIVVVLGTTFLISGLRVVPNALLQRDLRFKLLAGLEAINVMVLSASMVALALAGFRYWTLVVGAILGAIVTTVLTVACRPHPFRWPRWKALRNALTFTRYQLGGNLLWYGYSNADLVIAGRLLGKADLGVYALALSIASSIPEKITTLVIQVTPAYFAALQDEPAALKRYLLRLTEMISVITFPALFGLAVVADDFVRLALGPKWIEAVNPLRLLAIYAAINAASPLLSRVLTVRGQTRYLMWFGVGQLVLLPISFAIGSLWGPTGIAAAWVLVLPLTRVPIFRRVSASIGVCAGEYLRAFWPAISSAGAMALGVAALQQALPADMPLALRLILEVAWGGALYFALLVACHRDRVSLLLQLRAAWRERPAA